MKKQLLVTGLMLISTWVFAQVSEIESAETLKQNGNINAALEVLEQVEGAIGNAGATVQTRFYVLKGETYFADAVIDNDLGKMKTSAGAFANAEQLDTGEFQVRLDAGKQLLSMTLVSSAIQDQGEENFARASEKLYTAYQVDNDPSYLYYAAENSVSAKDYDTALEYYYKLIETGFTGTEIDPENGDVYQKVIQLHINQVQTDSPVVVTENGGPDNPDDTGTNSERISGGGQTDSSTDAVAAYNRGIELYNDGMFTEAIAAFDEAVNAWPEFSEAHYELGMTAYLVDQYDQARLHLQKYLELLPEGELTSIAESVLAEMGQPSPSGPAPSAPIGSDSESELEMVFERGIRLYEADDLQGAMIAFKEAVEKQPEFSDAHLQLGLTAYIVDEYDLSRLHLQRYLELAPEGENAATARFFLTDLDQSTDSDVADFESLAEAEAAFDRGTKLYEEDRFEEAMAEFEQAVRLDPAFSEAHYELGMLAFVVDETDKARLHLEKFLELEPDGDLAELVRITLSGLD